MPAEPAAAVEEAMPLSEPTKNLSSPPMKVNRETIIANADIRALDAQSPAAGNVTNQVMLDKITELEGMVDKLKAENIALNDEVRASVDASKEEKLNITSDNWNLEQATIRFNESERQVKRLGQELQMERARCSGEKKDLEAMLFDPQVTDQQQLARLSQLESELAAAKAEVEDQRARYEAQIKLLQGQNVAH
jgi:chromosome segregation ATPase